MSISIRVIQGKQEFSSLRNVWEELEDSLQHGNLSSSYQWLFSWWSVFEKVENNEIGYNKSLLILEFSEEGKITGILPLVRLIRKYFGFKISFLELLGQQWGATYLDFISRKLSFDEREGVFNFIFDNFSFDILMFKYIPQNSPFFKPEELILYSACPFINLSDFKSFEEFKNQTYSKNLKQNIRTALNRLEKKGEVLFKSIDEINHLNFEQIEKISKSKLEDKKGWVYGDKNKSEFLRRIYKALPSNVSIIKLNEISVAYRTNVFFNNIKFCLDASYDRTYGKYELGSFSMDLNIRDSFNKNVLMESMGPGTDAYKFRFTNKVKFIYFYLKPGNNFFSALIYWPVKILAGKKAKNLLKQLSTINKV